MPASSPRFQRCFQSGKWARDGLVMDYILVLAGEASDGGGDVSTGFSESPLVPVCEAWNKSMQSSLVWPHKVGLFIGHVACQVHFLLQSVFQSWSWPKLFECFW